MHVAVCDDNVADRKQMERLLGRESDRRAKITEGLYIDSYGNESALLRNPMVYDIFYIDMCQSEDTTGTKVVHALCDIGVHVPIYLCCSSFDYRQESFPENVFFLDKPIKTDLLIASLDKAYTWKQNAIPRIELRDEASTSTYYVTADDILYGTTKNRHINIYLSDGRVIPIASEMENLYGQWMHHQVFLPLSNKVIININYVKNIGLWKVYMKNNTAFSLTPSSKKMLKEIIAQNASQP